MLKLAVTSYISRLDRMTHGRDLLVREFDVATRKLERHAVDKGAVPHWSGMYADIKPAEGFDIDTLRLNIWMVAS